MFAYNPIAVKNLFGIQGMDIAWYGIIIAAGIIMGVAVTLSESKRKGYKSDLIFDFLILAIPLAIVCARIYYVAFEWDTYAGDFYKAIAVWQGGIAIYGAVIGGIIAAFIVCKIKKFPLLRLLDITAPGLVLGQAIGRWGNFMNQEAFGNLIINPSRQFFPFAVYIQRLGEWHQATFFYESMWDFGVFILLMFYKKSAKFDGNVFAMYFIAYGIGRFFIEGLRTDSLYVLPGIRISQVLSLVFIAGGIVYILLRRKMRKRDCLYEGKYNIV